VLLTALACAAALALAPAVRAQTHAGEVDLLSRVGTHVAEYYGRARTLLARETVRLQPVDAQMRPSGEWRQLVYDVRIEWDPARPGEAAIARELVSASGRVGQLPPGEAECFDLRSVTAEPLAMLLPERQKHYAFSSPRSSGRHTVIDFKPATPSAPTVTWRGNCVSIDLKGRTHGRVWIDRDTAAVVRIDERLTRPFPFVTPNGTRGAMRVASQTVDRAEVSVRYEPVTFREPDETLMLPASIRSFWEIYNGGVPRMLMQQTYGEYKRFMTAGRVVK
jgi:hypothetical protein